MGQLISVYCFFVCPRRSLKNEVLLYKGRHSVVYRLKNTKMVCKVVSTQSMYLREKKFLQLMRQHGRHPHIVWCHRLTRGMFIMERAEQDLLGWWKDHFQKAGCLWQLTIWMGQLAQGYRFLLANQVEHYDIKPDNLLLVGDVLKIADFGTCQVGQSSYVMHTGTYAYIAPEVVGATPLDQYVPHSMDVFSICIMIMYLHFPLFFRVFYRNKIWTSGKYLSLEYHVRTQYPFLIYSRGLVMDQHRRLSITDLLDHLEYQSQKALR